MKNKGFTTINFDNPFPVTFFFNSSSFNLAKGVAIGVELCNEFGSERLIVRHETVTRKVTGAEERWANNLVYLYPCDVEGWVPGQRAGLTK